MLSPSVRVLVAAWVLLVAAVYCRDVGRGFVKDDFAWIQAARTAIADPSTLVHPRDPGFYRPLVTLTFAVDYTLYEWNARGYGWTNLALYAACSALIVWFAIVLGLDQQTAVLSAFLWAVNPHGINMAVLWLSGRTALCLVLFSVGATIAFIRQRYGIAAVLLGLALASKEEAVALPAILLFSTRLIGGTAGRPIGKTKRLPLKAAAAALVPLAVYLVLRSLTPAFTPATAPWFYELSRDPRMIVRNLGEYMDRSATLPASAAAVGLALWRIRPAVTERDKQIGAFLAMWWLAMLALTVWVPVRSSLYAVCPSVATAMTSALVIQRMREARSRAGGAPARFRTAHWRLEPLLAVGALAAIPLYQARNGRWVEPARVSQRTLSAIRSDLTILPSTGSVVLQDEPASHPFENAYGTLITVALRTVFDRAWEGAIEEPGAPPPSDAGSNIVAEYRIDRGRIWRVLPPVVPH